MRFALKSLPVAVGIRLSVKSEAEAAALIRGDGTQAPCAKKAFEDAEAAAVPEWVKQHWQQTKCDKAMRQSEDMCKGSSGLARAQREALAG